MSSSQRTMKMFVSWMISVDKKHDFRLKMVRNSLHMKIMFCITLKKWNDWQRSRDSWCNHFTWWVVIVVLRQNANSSEICNNGNSHTVLQVKNVVRWIFLTSLGMLFTSLGFIKVFNVVLLQLQQWKIYGASIYAYFLLLSCWVLMTKKSLLRWIFTPDRGERSSRVSADQRQTGLHSANWGA